MPTDINNARRAFSEYLQGKENFKKSLDGAFLAAMEVIYQEAFSEGQRTAPEGWKLVPIEPTEGRLNEARNVYRACVEAAPKY